MALGVTAEYTVAVWAGNADGRPTAELPAMRAAAPLLRDALLALAGGLEPVRGSQLRPLVTRPAQWLETRDRPLHFY